MLHRFLRKPHWILLSPLLIIFLVFTSFFGHQLSLPSSEHHHNTGSSHTAINCETKCGSKPVQIQTLEEAEELKDEDKYLYSLTRNALVITLFGIVLYQLTRWLGTRKIPIYKQVACYRI